jgi:putative transposase
MKTREMTADFKLSNWAKIIQDRNASGQSTKDYCKESGIKENVYYYWQRKLREEACNKLQISLQKDIINNSQATDTPTGWAICETITENAVEEKGIKIEIGNCRITVTSDIDLELLTKVCRVLTSL